MGQKISYEAQEIKKGMSLAELQRWVENAVGLAGVNEKPIEQCSVTVFVNIRGGIKQLVVEV